MKIFTTNQIRDWDQYTIEHEPITSLDLMDRASGTFADWFMRTYSDTSRPIWIFCGTGNNGGDGLAVGRILSQHAYTVHILICGNPDKQSPDFTQQLSRFPIHQAEQPIRVNEQSTLPSISENAILIDAIFGTGLTKAPEGIQAQMIHFINALPNETVSIDLPSGMFSEYPTPGPCIEADRTFSFEVPKIGFFFQENRRYLGDWTFGSIGLDQGFVQNTDTKFHFLQKSDVKELIRKRDRFGHKGNYGHALLVVGSRGKIGAAILAARASLRAGVGLLTTYVPGCGYKIMQASVPEAMCITDLDTNYISDIPKDMETYSAIGVGCGIGMAQQVKKSLAGLIRNAQKPLVLDADALNLLAHQPEWWSLIPKGSILTPHPKEFERLFGTTKNDFERNILQREKAAQHKVFILLKGAYSVIACPDGCCWFNSTGNPGMATGGSGDVLTGILTGLIASGYAPEDAVRIGVYLHGLAGDFAAAKMSQPGMIASDIIQGMGEAWKALEA